MKQMRSFLIVFLSTTLLVACGGGTLNPTTRNTLPMSAASHSSQADAALSGYKSLYAFKGTPDGASPYSGLVAVGNTFYGTTLNGSKNYCSQNCSNNCYLGCGTVFSVDSSGNEHVAYNFSGNFNNGRDGSWPFAGLTLMNGSLYGTTSSAGAYHHGTVYTVSTSGQERVLYDFMGGSGDAEAPEAGVTALKGRLYGTSLYGGGTGCGGAGCGTVYWLTTTGKEFVLYSFKGGSDGDRVYAPVTVLHDTLYGATLFGGGAGCGSNGCGTFFKVTLNGKERVLYRFTNASDGAYPNGLIAVNGVLYGTTESGGNKNSGTFFSVTPSGTLKTLYNFQDIPDGNLPGATLIYSKGLFYGTTVGGGSTGVGTVFKVSKTGSEKVLYSFKGGTDGSDPQGPVYLFGGKLYGTTTTGGGIGCGGNGCGTIFKLQP